jgi:P-type Mg2+ transporter
MLGTRSVTTAPATRPPIARSGSADWDSARLLEAARCDAAGALTLCQSAGEGLTQAEAEHRLTTCGPNEIAAQKPEGWYIRLLHALRNPLVILLAVLATVSLATGDLRAATVMTLMIILGVTLRFMQESRASAAAAALRAMIRVTATALRDRARREVPLREIGAMDVLCTDKTGTLTMDTVILERHCDVQGNESDRVLVDAMLISHLQTSIRSTLDEAILKH